MRVKFAVMVMAVTAVRFLRDWFYISAGNVFEEVLISLKLERHVFGEECILTSGCNLDREDGHVFGIVKGQRIGRVARRQNVAICCRGTCFRFEDLFGGFFDGFDVVCL